MGVKFTNNAYTTLASTISASATSFDLASAATFPTLAAGDWTYVSLTDEVVKVTAISGVTCTCEAVSGGHSAGIAVELRMTAELLNDFAEDLGSGYKGGDIASASPTVIDTDGDYFNVTGTTGFSAFTVAANRLFVLQFAGALTMTHHATNLDLPGEANITTAAGDVAEFFSTGTNTVQCLNYTKADGTAVVGVDATSVTAAGALMDSECAGLAAVKATTGTFLTADQTKLDAIEASATADQTAGEILTLIEDGVDSVHYKDGSIDNVHLADDAVDSDELAAGSVDNAHLADDAVDSDELAAGAVDNAHIDASAGIAVTKIAAMPYDLGFTGGFDKDLVKEDVAVATYGEMVMARACTITGEVAYVDTAPTGATLIMDIMKNGTTIYASTKPLFAISANTHTVGVATTTALVSGDRVTFKITQIGSTEPGEGVRFTLKCKTNTNE